MYDCENTECDVKKLMNVAASEVVRKQAEIQQVNDENGIYAGQLATLRRAVRITMRKIPKIDTLSRIAVALGTSMDELYSDFWDVYNKQTKERDIWLVICYSVHNKEVASVDSFSSYDAAIEFLETDAQNTYEEELNGGSDDVDFTLDKGEAYLASCDHENEWTWEIVQKTIR